MECEYEPDWGNNSLTLDLCWAGEDTLIEVRYETNVTYRYTVNKDEKTCKRQVLDFGYIPIQVACTRQREVFITSYTEPGKVWVYDLDMGRRQIWEPLELKDMFMTVTVNEHFIVFTEDYDGISFIYTRERVFLYKIEGELYSRYTFVTPNNFLWAGSIVENEYHIIDLETNETSSKPGGDFGMFCIDGTRQGYVYITVSNFDTKEVYMTVHLESGQFLHLIDISSLHFHLYPIQSTIEHGDGSTLMAFASAHGAIGIAVLEP